MDGQGTTTGLTAQMRVRAVVFDVDGTLVNSLEGIHEAASRAAASFGYEVSYGAVRRAMNSGESLWDLVLPEEKRGDAQLIATLRSETMRHWPAVLAGSVRVFSGLEHTLRELQTAGLRLAICTGSRGESFLPLRRAGLMECFDPVITAQDVRRPKPHPEGLQLCLARLGCQPGEAVYVGDSSHDIAAGQAAGMRVVGVLTGAADSAELSAAGADWLIAGHHRLASILLGVAG
jgi:HAD superfamily hydrolase (TIGR01509 family)